MFGQDQGVCPLSKYMYSSALLFSYAILLFIVLVKVSLQTAQPEIGRDLGDAFVNAYICDLNNIHLNLLLEVLYKHVLHLVSWIRKIATFVF